MPSNQAYAGIDIGGTNIKYGLIDPNGKILFKEQRPTLVEKGAEPLMHLVANIAESLLYSAAEDDYEIRWLGVGTPGAVDARTGKVIGLSPQIAGWQGMEVGQILKERLNLPVLVDNDVNAMALGEARFGAGIGYRSVICTAIGTGVGGGIILDGKLWRGANHSAGEIGHTTVNFDGPVCRCGQKGCVEVYCSSQAILTRMANRLRRELSPIFAETLDGNLDNLSIKKMFIAAKKGDEAAREVIEESADFLAIGLANAVNLLNPDIVVIGGGVAEGGGGFVEAVTAGIRKRALASATKDLRITRATLGNDAGFIGASILGEVRG